MPSKNEVKIYIPDGIYHIYNRGVDKRQIFMDEQDYRVFLSYIKTYLLPKNEEKLRNKLTEAKISLSEKDHILKLLRMNNFSGDMAFIAYALMPNHFHFLVQQKSGNTINKFMNSLITRYSMYFNRKHKRIGPLFQGVYKAVIVDSEKQLLHLSRYIHYQTLYNSQGQILSKQHPSSYPNYINKKGEDWIKTETILEYFKNSKKKINSYEVFVSNLKENDLEIIDKIKIDD